MESKSADSVKKVSFSGRVPVPRVVSALPSWNTPSVKTICDTPHIVQRQIDILDRLLHPQCDTDISPECELAFGEIRRKQYGYIAQDKKKNRPFQRPLRTVDIIRLMRESGMICHYCHHPVCVLYESRFYPKQWTLDRRDNTKAHDVDNVVISCLSCNIKRRTQNMQKFKVSKTYSHVRLVDGEEEEEIG